MNYVAHCSTILLLGTALLLSFFNLFASPQGKLIMEDSNNGIEFMESRLSEVSQQGMGSYQTQKQKMILLKPIPLEQDQHQSHFVKSSFLSTQRKRNLRRRESGGYTTTLSFSNGTNEQQELDPTSIKSNKQSANDNNINLIMKPTLLVHKVDGTNPRHVYKMVLPGNSNNDKNKKIDNPILNNEPDTMRKAFAIAEESTLLLSSRNAAPGTSTSNTHHHHHHSKATLPSFLYHMVWFGFILFGVVGGVFLVVRRLKKWEYYKLEECLAYDIACTTTSTSGTSELDYDSVSTGTSSISIASGSDSVSSNSSASVEWLISSNLSRFDI